ncbi:hypothetical protein [Cryptosporangium arvum]|uniref:hypothetical protein n=1 Tax=Cryptosporangium arvum TaxID=80871 RepID=UPI0006885E71|nr:hypothetical protein [Cryptosporangium arvum]
MTITRALSIAYLVYAAAAAAWLWRLGHGLASVGAVCALLAAAAPLFRRRRVLLGVHAVMIPAQFVFSVPSNVPLLGLMLSVAIVVALRPRPGRLSPRTRKVALTVHVGLSVGWLGLAMAMTVLAVVGLTTSDDVLRHDVYRIMHLFDLVIVIPVVVLTILSGLVVSLFTRWGLFRHWWVLIKFVLALAVPMVAGVQHLWIAELIDRTAADPTAVGVRLLVCFALYDVVLWTATALSVFKPGRTTPWTQLTARAR